MNRMGRPAIFHETARGVKRGCRIYATLTREGGARFEAARVALAALVKWPTKRVSDADVVEYLARGRAATIEWLEFK